MLDDNGQKPRRLPKLQSQFESTETPSGGNAAFGQACLAREWANSQRVSVRPRMPQVGANPTTRVRVGKG